MAGERVIEQIVAVVVATAIVERVVGVVAAVVVVDVVVVRRVKVVQVVVVVADATTTADDVIVLGIHLQVKQSAPRLVVRGGAEKKRGSSRTG